MSDEKKLEEIRDQLKEILGKIEELIPIKEGESEYADWYVRRMNILADILEKGGTVKKIEFHRIMDKNDMDPRGGGGFFIKSNPSLTYFEDAEGEKVALTRKGKEAAQDWISEKRNKKK